MKSYTTSAAFDAASIRRTDIASRISRTGAATFVLLLVILHLIRPDLDPSWRFISEYANGPHGWMMVAAFIALATSFVSLFVALRSQVRTIAGRIGLAGLLVSATGLIIAAIFPTDPVTTPPDAMTPSGKLHALGGALGIAMPVATGLLSWNLARNIAWRRARTSMIVTAVLALIATMAFIAAIALMAPANGVFGPEVRVAWFGRLEIVAYSAWLMVVAKEAAYRA